MQFDIASANVIIEEVSSGSIQGTSLRSACIFKADQGNCERSDCERILFLKKKSLQICAEAGMTLQAEHDRKMKLILPKEELKKSKKVYIFQNLFFKRPYWVNLHPHFPGEAAFDARLEKFLAAGPSK